MTPEERDRLARLEVRVEGIDEWLKSIDAKQDQILAQANRWKGGFMVILALGGLIGWFADKIMALFAKVH